MAKKTFVLCLCAWVTTAFLGVANGSILDEFELYDVNRLEDADFETILVDNDTIVEGDVLVGMWEISTLQFFDAETGSPSGGAMSPSPATGVFLVEVGAKSGSGAYSFDFQPAGDADWSSVGLSRNDEGTMGVLYDDPDGLNFPDGSLTLAQELAEASDGTLMWEFGFTGPLNDNGTPGVTDDFNDPANQDEFWTGQTDSDDITDSGLGLLYAASLNVTDHGAGPPLDPHDFISQHLVDSTSPPNSVTTLWPDPSTNNVVSDLQLEGSNDGSAAAPFSISTETDIYIVPTPEPGAMAVWGLGLVLVGLGATVRRRRK